MQFFKVRSTLQKRILGKKLGGSNSAKKIHEFKKPFDGLLQLMQISSVNNCFVKAYINGRERKKHSIN